MTPGHAPLSLHATAVVIGERGILIRGRAGMGKSSLADLLVDRAKRHDRFARLVGDDRVVVELHGGRLVARAHPAIAGLIERRGVGLVPVAHESGCVLRLVVDLLDRADLVRLPEPRDGGTALLGVALRRLAVVSPPGLRDAIMIDAEIGAI